MKRFKYIIFKIVGEISLSLVLEHNLHFFIQMLLLPKTLPLTYLKTKKIKDQKIGLYVTVYVTVYVTLYVTVYVTVYVTI